LFLTPENFTTWNLEEIFDITGENIKLIIEMMPGLCTLRAHLKVFEPNLFKYKRDK